MVGALVFSLPLVKVVGRERVVAVMSRKDGVWGNLKALTKR